MDLGLKDHAYVVTGGSRGLGLATAQSLLAENACVVLSGRGAEVEKTAAALGGQDRVIGIAADNADESTPERLVTTAQDHFGRLDGALISVAARAPARRWTQTTAPGVTHSKRSSWAPCESPAWSPPPHPAALSCSFCPRPSATHPRPSGFKWPTPRVGHARENTGRRTRPSRHAGQRPVACLHRDRPCERTRRQ